MTASWVSILACNRLVKAGIWLGACLVFLALAAPTLTRLRLMGDPIEQNLSGLDPDGMPRGPGNDHFLGTDSLGRDVCARVVHGARVTLTIGIAAMMTATGIGLLVGLLAGFYGGKLDLTLMRLTEINMTIPAILLAIAFAGLIQQDRIFHLHPKALEWHFLDVHLKRGMSSLFLIIGFVCWPGMVRVIRAQVMSIKEREFVQAARALGASHPRIVLSHILPNILPTVIVLAVMNTANAVLLEAGLGYLGVGVPAPTPTWGLMIAEGQPYFIAAPHIVIAPGVAIVLTVLAFNLLGQGLHEVLESRQGR